ncbi:MAG TPA: hypothetical protein DDX39_02745 [Bacteroidales bacterium]|nr:MAG: hypothetical protein A2W98_03760 [Bacteroidetes bacterium GWF2_33_38]OFY91679.1 MAG: hypothetical protein A2236_12380 [Bacteroidetes bacterium RIFOXYA2_FULL_33_7]HBF87535.1 hypothetical protein [Bacteroidales bacterium]
MNNKNNILIVDSHPIFVEGIRTVFQNLKDVYIIADECDVDMAIEQTKNKRINLIIVEIIKNHEKVNNLITHLKSNSPHLKILLLLHLNYDGILNESLFNEATGIILRNSSKEEFLTAVNEVLINNTFYSKDVLQLIVQKFKLNHKKADVLSILSNREFQILKLICQEFSSQEIAEKLFISRRTVDTHRQHIIEKTKLKSIVGLIKFAIRNSIIDT